MTRFHALPGIKVLVPEGALLVVVMIGGFGAWQHFQDRE